MEHESPPSVTNTALDHIVHIPAYLEDLRQSQLFCDVRIKFRDEGGWGSLKCHRSVLAAATPLLKHALHDEAEEEAVVITEMTKEELSNFLTFIYTGVAGIENKDGLIALGMNLATSGFLQNDEFAFVENVGWEVKQSAKITLFVTDVGETSNQDSVLDLRSVEDEEKKMMPEHIKYNNVLEEHSKYNDDLMEHSKYNNESEDRTICVNVDDQGNYSMEDSDLREPHSSRNCNKKYSKKIMQIHLGVSQELENDYEEDTRLVSRIDEMINSTKNYKKSSVEHNSLCGNTKILYLGVQPSSTGTSYNKNTLVTSKLDELKTTSSKSKVKKNFQCVECGDRFSTETKLTTHEADIHLALECRICGQVLKGHKLLIDHAALHNQNNFNRDILFEKSKDKPADKALKKIQSKVDEKPTCDICSETFVTKQALKFHEYKHSGIRPYVCKVCETSFRTPSTLRAHFDVQHSRSKHKCNQCGLQSSTSGKLKIHMRTHSNEKPYQCSFCPSRFKQLQVLKIHEFTHTKESKYKCLKCYKYFPSKSRLIKHESQPVCKSKPRTPKTLQHLPRPEGIFTSESSPIYKLSQSAEGDFEKDLKQTPSITTVINKYDTDEDGFNKPTDISGGESLNTTDIPVLVDELPVIESDSGAFNFFENKN